MTDVYNHLLGTKVMSTNVIVMHSCTSTWDGGGVHKSFLYYSKPDLLFNIHEHVMFAILCLVFPHPQLLLLVTMATSQGYWYAHWSASTSLLYRFMEPGTAYTEILVQRFTLVVLCTFEISSCMNNQCMNLIFPQKGRLWCYTKSPTAQDMFQLIPDLISCAGRLWLLYLMHNAVSQVAGFIYHDRYKHLKGSIYLWMHKIVWFYFHVCAFQMLSSKTKVVYLW